MKTPKAVLISDIHFTPSTLELASASLRQALYQAQHLKVPLVICGDTLDTKAIVRAECMNAVIDIIGTEGQDVPTYAMVGNHDRINEKSEAHALEFLRPYCHVVSDPVYVNELSAWLIPYTHNIDALKTFVTSNTRAGELLIMHQGVHGAQMGHYIVDNSALCVEDLEGLTVYSGHYHARQTVYDDRSPDGWFTYVGNPYTLTFGEANDPPKGFQILNTDNSLTFVPTNLRKHIIVERTADDVMSTVDNYNAGDLVWLKISGPRSSLHKLDKQEIGRRLFGHSNFKLDLLPIDTLASKEQTKKVYTHEELMDQIIDRTQETDAQKADLKALWRELV